MNVYGLSKLKGEELAMAAQPDCIIIRTSWVYSPFGKNFVKTMMKLMQERAQIGVVDDQRGKPTYAADLAEAIFNIIFKHNHPTGGRYHYANEGETTWYAFAVAIKQICGFTCEIKPILTSDFPTPAKRPSYSTLDTQKIKEVFDISIPDWRKSLEHCLHQLQSHA